MKNQPLFVTHRTRTRRVRQMKTKKKVLLRKSKSVAEKGWSQPATEIGKKTAGASIFKPAPFEILGSKQT